MFKTQAERDAEEQKARDEGKDAPSSAAGGEDDDAAPKEKPPLKPVRILEGMAASGLRAIRACARAR